MLSSAMLVVFGTLAFFIAGSIGIMLDDVVPHFLKAFNEVGFSVDLIVLGIFLGLFGLIFWYYSCVGIRCHTLLYKRWFK